TALGVSQVNISRIEREDEPQLSTMRRFVEALGGELIVQVRIGDETIDLLTYRDHTHSPA
ncbi:MAG: helix-turn-helix transcriptional regulator, partial [Chloroflexota bacterium]|nr:helix-turn-helix transcriptional regulator [Chloroflexota bacterium]